MSTNPQSGTPIIDGFTFNTRIATTQSYYHNVLAQLEPLRRANGFRCRWFGVPDPSDLPIAPFSSVEYQIQVQPGSYLWGYNFYATTGNNPPTTAQPVNCIRIVDACTELPLADRQVLSVAMTGTLVGTNQQQFSLGQNRGPVLLVTPYLVAAPGFLNVEITNGGSSPSTCQLLLMFAEPSIYEPEIEKLIARRIK